MTLRPYQQEAADAAIDFMRGSIEPCLIDAATGAGKSHIIADIAARIHKMTSKKVLCLAPSAELVQQNRAKFLASGHKASMYSASAGAKELRYPVVFGSPLTVKNRISRFKDGYAMVIVDECHGITPTLKSIIEAMREGNPNLRVLGLTATPYRLGSGYIFRMWPDDAVNDDGQTRDPYFMKCVYQVHARTLIDQGFLTKPVIGEINAAGYDTAGLTLNSRGQFDADDVDRAYHGHGRKTSGIVADVLGQAQGRAGVMFFAATVKHAQEVLASLPPELSAIVTGDTPKAERASILTRFKARQIKYIVNVSVLTTGFDAPHVDLIAILRKTESVGLLQQIIGRGLRICEGKSDCVVLDYTTNLDDHCPDGDLFAPLVKANKVGESAGGMKAVCPDCEYENTFTTNPKYLDFKVDDAGYIVDLDGNRIESEWGPIAGHHGRRCFGMYPVGGGKYERCGYRWTSKPCPECDAPNDIAARHCCECRAEIVDPNEKLIGDFRALKRDPTRKQTDEVLSMQAIDSLSAKGNKTIRVEWVTPYRQFTTWFMPEAKFAQAVHDYEMWRSATSDGEHAPKTLTYRKDEKSGFYRVHGYNHQMDMEPQIEAI